MTNIPASAIVRVNPGVIQAGGIAIDLNGLALSESTRVPIGEVYSFGNAAAVGTFFGSTSDEKAAADVYFAGYENSPVKPAAMLFAQYPGSAVAAYLRGGSVASLTLAQLQAFSGVLTVTINGVLKTSSSINLSGATSFSNAAALIQTGLAAYDAVVTGSISTTTLTVTAVSSGALAVGQTISGSGITPGTKITALGSGTGGTGTYTISVSQTASSTTVSTGPALVTYDSVSGAFVVTGGTPGATGTITFAGGSIAASLKLTQATGAVTSQGAAAAVPGAFMDDLVDTVQDWATFFTIWEPSTNDKVLFAAWVNAQDDKYLYAMWDTDVTVTLPNPTTSAGYLIQQADYAGVALIYTASFTKAAFVAGWAASIDFAATNGRADAAFRSQSGMVADVTSLTIADQLIANGYNYYGSYATATTPFLFFYNGSVTGPFAWLDTYINQIWLNANLQLDLMQLLVSVGSVPYNNAGYAQIQTACSSTISDALNNGVIRAGVPLGGSQKAAVNNAAGLDVATTIQQQGWYLQVKPASADVRAERDSPPCTLWYTDGGSIQKITLSSLAIQ